MSICAPYRVPDLFATDFTNSGWAAVIPLFFNVGSDTKGCVFEWLAGVIGWELIHFENVM